MRNLFLLCTLITLAPSLCCMEQQPSTLTDPSTLIKQIIVSNVIHLSHNEVCAWALVNKNYNKIITDTVILRKNYLKNCALKKGTPIIDADITWHKNGSAYTWVPQEEKLNNYPEHILVYLIDHGKSSTNHLYHGNKIPYPYAIDNKHRSFFNCKGEAYVHVFHYINVPDDGESMNMLEYSLRTTGHSKISRCLIDLDDRGELINFVNLLHFPVLIEAFLQSTEVREGLTYLRKYYPQIRSGDTAKIYSIKGVTIPNNYALFKESNVYSSPFTSFDEEATDPLIIRLKDAIIKKASIS